MPAYLCGNIESALYISKNKCVYHTVLAYSQSVHESGGNKRCFLSHAGTLGATKVYM